MPAASDPATALSQALREDRGRIIAALLARLRDFQLAEDALQEASASALIHWERAGVPDRPRAWLIRVAFRKAIDHLRRTARDAAQVAELAVLARDEAEEPEMIADERLRLIFTCCHPALELKSRVALTLRTICGLTTAEIARAFLDQEATMGQRLSRAKAKIVAAHIPFRVPDPEDWHNRLSSVLSVLYLIFNAGYDDSTGKRDLVDEAIFLGRLLNALHPADAEVEGAIALMLLTQARHGARFGEDGVTVPPAIQDRGRWDGALIAEGLIILQAALARDAPGPFQIKASIAACHFWPDRPDWVQILTLYQALCVYEPTPVVQLNLAVAMAETGQLLEAITLVQELGNVLQDYQPFHAVLADLARRLGRRELSLSAYDHAIRLATRPEDAAFLRKRRAELTNQPGS